jgi:hypothetical protein
VWLIGTLTFATTSNKEQAVSQASAAHAHSHHLGAQRFKEIINLLSLQHGAGILPERAAHHAADVLHADTPCLYLTHSLKAVYLHLMYALVNSIVWRYNKARCHRADSAAAVCKWRSTQTTRLLWDW